MRPDDDCDHTHLAAGWILGTLTPEEAQQFAAHLPACVNCQAEIASLQAAADAMADAVPQVVPPPGLRARLIATVRGEAELFRAAEAHEPDRETIPVSRRRSLRSALLAVAAASLVAGGMLLGAALADPDDDRPRTRTLPGRVTLLAGGPDARAAIQIRGNDARLVLSNVEAAPEGRIYQAWLERPPSPPAPTGALFSLGTTGDTTISLPPLRGAQRMIVTSERTGGSTTPTLPPVMTVDLATPERTSG